MWNTGAPAGVHNLKCKELYMDAQEDMHMNDYNKITALYSRRISGTTLTTMKAADFSTAPPTPA